MVAAPHPDRRREPPALAGLSPARAWPLFASLLLGIAVYLGGTVPLLAVAGASVASWAVYRFRASAVVVLAAAALVPQLVRMLRLLPEGWEALAYGVGVADLVLVGMWGASFALLARGFRERRASGPFAALSILVFAILTAAVLRNWGAYGLSAFGELRTRYLVFGLPVFLALGLDSAADRSTAARALAWLPVAGVATMLPVAVARLGWAWSAESRFFPASVSVALVLASVWVVLSRRREDATVGAFAAVVVLGLSAVILLKDAHRSVWLVALVSIVILLWLRVLPVRRVLAAGIGFVVVAAIAALAIGPSVDGVAGYVGSRGQAFIDPVDDPSSFWRIATWRAYLSTIREHPLIGQGFGGYWNVYVPELMARIYTSPHSLYIQSAVKLGAVGLAAVLAWFAAAGRSLVRAARAHADGGPAPLVVMGVIGVVCSLVFGTVYPLELWLLAWAGLGLAELRAGGGGDGT